MSIPNEIPRGASVSGRRRPEQSARAVFSGVQWREVPDFYWSGLTVFASQMTMATWGAAVVGGQLVQFAGN